MCGEAVNGISPLALEEVYRGGESLARVQEVIHDDTGAPGKGKEGGRMGGREGGCMRSELSSQQVLGFG